MAQNFRRYTSKSVGTSATSVYTANSYDTIVGISVANIGTSSVLADVIINDGSNDIYGEYLINAQGEDVVAGTRTPQYITKKAKKEANVKEQSMEESMPKVYSELIKILKKLLMDQKEF